MNMKKIGWGITFAQMKMVTLYDVGLQLFDEEINEEMSHHLEEICR